MSGSGTWGAGVWGQNQWNDLADPTFTLTGIALSASLGDETTVGEINTGWGRANWGDFAWGVVGNVVATGDAVTATLGSPVISIDVSTGPSTNNNQLITTNLGSPTIDIQTKVFPSGLPLTATEGTADAGPDAMATGIAMSMGLGTVQAYNQTGWGRQEWSENAWGVEGQYANVTLTGIAMTAALGNETITGSATLTLNTLNLMNATLGQADPAPDANAFSQLMTANLGTALGQAGAGATPSGIAMTAGLGTVTAVPGQEIVPTGFPLEARLSSAFVIKIHVDIPVTGLSLTMNQGSGSALIWNEVNTGSAPITPPGWQEVAA
tara:strand:+ start:54 stop:1022 length:969 start_codon:yes stop_codon:yes gene_type:complete